MRHLRPLAAATLLTAIAATIAGVLIVTLTASGGTQEVTLDGVSAGALDTWGVRILSPRESPNITAEAAAGIAAQNKSGAEVKEVVLVHLLNERPSPAVDRLAWAVNLDPASIFPIPDLGPGGPNPPSWDPCDEAVAFDVLFIDAESGEFIFEMQQSADAGDRPCPIAPSTDIAPSPLPGETG